MSKKLTSYSATRGCRRLVHVNGPVDRFGETHAFVFGRALSDIGPRQDVQVPASGLTNIDMPGGKCEHGVYIAGPFLSTERAEYCSLCRPYEIAVKQNGVYKA